MVILANTLYKKPLEHLAETSLVSMSSGPVRR